MPLLYIASSENKSKLSNQKTQISYELLLLMISLNEIAEIQDTMIALQCCRKLFGLVLYQSW